MTFSDLGLSESLLKTLSDKGYVSPTPIQAQIIPLILRGSDVLACAPTGTGKTASFSLPLVEILSETSSKARLIRCLILVPTRELATQVCDSFKDYTKNHKLKVAQFIGGASIVQQKQVLQKGVDVAIATPGRFLDLCETGNILPTEIKNVVIDEADRMMDMGFMPDLRKILGALPKMRQTVLLSATMPPAIKKLAQEFLMSPKEVMVEAPSTTSANIQQYFVNIPALKSESERLRKQLDVMIAIFRKCSISSAVIFCNKKHHVDKIYAQMQKKKMAVEVIHGDLSQSRRNRSIENMKSGASQFLVASDVAARGIDISNMPCVINMDIPMNIEDYVHRIGRTGRAGAEGLAFTMVTPTTQNAAKDVMRMIGKQIEFIKDLEGDLPESAESDWAPVAPEEKPAVSEGEKTNPLKKKHQKKEISGLPEKKDSEPSPEPRKQRQKAISSGPKKEKNGNEEPKGFGDDLPAFLRKNP